MLHLLIVDDEIECLESLKNLFEGHFPEEIGVFTASSSKKAIEIMTVNRCDIAIIDINMPGMNGVELYYYLKERSPDLGILFLTGYSNLEIMYQIIKEKNVRYLMKIEVPQVILDTVHDIWNDIEKEHAQTEKIRICENKYYMINDATYYQQKEVLEGIIFMDNKFKPKEELFGASIDIKKTFLVFAGIRNTEILNISVDERRVVVNMFENMLPEGISGLFYVMESRYIFGMLQPTPNNTAASNDWNTMQAISCRFLESVQQALEKDDGQHSAFAIWGHPIPLSELNMAYFVLKDKLMANPSTKSVSITFLSEINAKNKRTGGQERYLKILFIKNYLEQSEFAKCKELLIGLGAALNDFTSMHDLTAAEIYYNISMAYLKAINMNGWNGKIPYHLGLHQLSRADSFNNWKEAIDYLLQLTDVFQNLKNENEETVNNGVISKLGHYIQGHLKDDLSLGYLAELGGFNASYLSRAFKQEYKYTMSEYILKERMSYAKKLLIQTDEKIYEIAEKVGYHTVTSFNKVFMKSEGQTPTDFRNQFRQIE